LEAFLQNQAGDAADPGQVAGNAGLLNFKDEILFKKNILNQKLFSL
jgi:hypothetical protein